MWLDHITSSGLGLDVHVDGIQIARYIPRPNARRCGTRCSGTPARSNRLPGEISVVEPPDPIPNSEVKRNCADGSVGFPCESRSSPGFYTRKPPSSRWGVCFCALETCWSVLRLQPKTAHVSCTCRGAADPAGDGQGLAGQQAVPITDGSHMQSPRNAPVRACRDDWTPPGTAESGVIGYRQPGRCDGCSTRPVLCKPRSARASRALTSLAAFLWQSIDRTAPFACSAAQVLFLSFSDRARPS